jgi:SAM-dependent methyltransferase
MSAGGPQTATFSAGGAEPWGRMLRGGHPGTLRLRRLVDGAIEEDWDAASFFNTADADDLAALGEFHGPLLDVGCGPGRMVRAAAASSSAALGIDVSADAVARARADGIPALERSIFDRVPLEGQWFTVLLMDGNIGIGGDPVALMVRCRELLAPGGVLVVEAHSDATLDVRSTFTVTDDHGNESDPFPWARVGWHVASDLALAAGFAHSVHVVSGQRHFVRART